MAGRTHPVIAVDRNGNPISYYGSIAEAARMNGTRHANISRSVINGKLHRGVRWLYEPDYRKLWFEGRTSELSFSVKQMRSESVRKGWRNRTESQREAHREACRIKRLEYLATHLPKTEQAWSKRRKPVLCITTDTAYESASALARHLGIDHSAVTYAIRHGRRTKGMIVKYITQEEFIIWKEKKSKRN